MDIDKSRVKKLVLNRSTVRKLGANAGRGSQGMAPPTDLAMAPPTKPTDDDTVEPLGPPTEEIPPEMEPLAPPTDIPSEKEES